MSNPFHRLAAVLICAFLTCPTSAQGLPEDPGPFPVGWTDVSFPHPLSGNPTVTARLYFPAMSAGQGSLPDPTAGPFPLVGFLHGFFAFVDYYDDVCTHLASHGFFVASVATESGFFMSIPNEAKDARAMLTWVEEQAVPGGPYAGMLTLGEDWSAVGHSNGGAASFHLASAEPRIARLVLFEPNWLNPPGVASFGGAVMVVGASEDFIAPAATNAATYFQALQQSPRSFYTVIEGSGHNGSLDFPIEVTTLTHKEAQAMHRRLATGFLLAETRGQEDLYALLVGAEAKLAPLDPTSRATNPVLWSSAASLQLNLGLAGRDDDSLALFALSTQPASVATPFGVLGVDLAATSLFLAFAMPTDGAKDVTLSYPASVVGLQIVLQGLRLAPAGTGVLTRVATQIL